MSDLALEILAGRWYAAPPELVFRTFVEPDLLERWFLPRPDVALRVERCEPHPGGAYRFAFYFPDGRMRLVVGTYSTVDRPRQLIFTWTWEDPDPWAGIVTQVTIDFVAQQGGTQVNIHHAGLPTEPMQQVHTIGWSGSLESLNRFLEERL